NAANLIRDVAPKLLLPAQDVLVDVRELRSLRDARRAPCHPAPRGLVSRRRTAAGETPVVPAHLSETRFVRQRSNRQIIRNSFVVTGGIEIDLAPTIARGIPG